MSILAVDTLKPRTTGVAVTVSGDLDITGALAVTGDISYDEVSGRNLDISGIATIQNLGVTGYSTFTGISTFNAAVRFPDDTKLHFGNTGGAFGDLQLWHDADAHSYIRDQGSGDLRIYGSAVDIRDNAGTASVARFTDDSVHLAGLTTVGILTSYESITIKVGSGSTEVATELKAKASTGKAIAMAMVFG